VQAPEIATPRRGIGIEREARHMSQFHSISHAGMAIFERPIESMFGSLEIDLASAPIAPGVHELHIETTIGSVEIYLPKHVAFTVDGGPLIGGHDVYDGLPFFKSLEHKLRATFGMANRIPAESAYSPGPTSIRFVIDGGVGGIDIYRI